MSLSDFLSIIIVLGIISLCIVYQIIKTYYSKKKEKMPELDDFIVAEFEKEYNRLKKEKEKDL